MTFPAREDGVLLSAWLITKPEHTKIVLANHPLTCTRSGCKSGLDGVEVNFLPQYKALFDAGYNILMWDNRSQGESEGGLKLTKTQVDLGGNKASKDIPCGVGSEEWKDVLGAMDYVKSQDTLAKDEVFILGQCMGGAAVLLAFEHDPQIMNSMVKACMLVQVPDNFNITARLTKKKMGNNLSEAVEKAQIASFGIPYPNLKPGLGEIKVPLAFLQMKEDMYTYNPETGKNDIEILAELAVNTPKKPNVILIGRGSENPYGTKNGKRFEGYNYFGKHPQKLIEFFDVHASSAGDAV